MKKQTSISPWHEDIINKVWNNPKKAFWLLMIDKLTVAYSILALAARVALLASGAEWIVLISELAVLGISFVAVSVLRRILNMPRPYEVGSIERIDASKSKRGESFPSRHVFSAFVIATVLLPWSVWLSVGLFVMGSLMAVVRVITGRHFIRDVVSGAIIGVLAGVIGLLII